MEGDDTACAPGGHRRAAMTACLRMQVAAGEQESDEFDLAHCKKRNSKAGEGLPKLSTGPLLIPQLLPWAAFLLAWLARLQSNS